MQLLTHSAQNGLTTMKIMGIICHHVSTQMNACVRFQTDVLQTTIVHPGWV